MSELRNRLANLADVAIGEEERYWLTPDLGCVLDAVEPEIRKDERAKIAAWLREQWLTPQELAGQIESGEYAE